MKNNPKKVSRLFLLIKRQNDIINDGIEYLQKHKGEIPVKDAKLKGQIDRSIKKREKILNKLRFMEQTPTENW